MQRPSRDAPFPDPAVRLAIAHLGTAKRPQVGVGSSELLLRVAARLRGRLLNAVRIVAAGQDHVGHLLVVADTSLFGPSWPGHGLGQGPAYFSRPALEPDYTKELAGLLSTGRHGEAGALRCRTLVEALYGATGQSARGAMCLDDLAPTVMVEAEHRIGIGPSARRLDLLISWTGKDGLARWVVLEAKFGHRVIAGALPAYRNYVRQQLGGLERAGLFVVGNRMDRQAARNSSWIQVSWFALLRRWEQLLAQTGDNAGDFSRFRGALWRQVRI